MSILAQIADVFSRWIGCVAATVNSLFDRIGSPQHVWLREDAGGIFMLHASGDGRKDSKTSALPDHRVRIAEGTIVDPLPVGWATMLRGSRTEVVLRPSRFLFRPLELPKRAADFLDGIIRSQIDRLTPWTAADAVFNWTPPVDIANDRIHMTIAATNRTMVEPYVEMLTHLGAASVVVSTFAPDVGTDGAPIRVLERRARGVVNIDRIRRVLLASFVVTGLAAAASVGFAFFAADQLDDQQQDLSQKITALRRTLRGGQSAAAGSARAELERRKHVTPSNVIVLEALSQILPDHTYVTELRIEGDKVQVVGITRDPPSLIRLFEQSPHFSRATFFAPTTNTPGEPGERFHIEAQIKAIFTLGT